MIAFTAERGLLAGKLLSLPPFVYTGTVSYSLYLWHWPVLVIAKLLMLSHGERIRKPYLAVIMVVISTISYKYIELPLRRWKTSFAALGLCFALLLASLLVSLYLLVRSPYYDTLMYSPVVWQTPTRRHQSDRVLSCRNETRLRSETPGIDRALEAEGGGARVDVAVARCR